MTRQRPGWKLERQALAAAFVAGSWVSSAAAGHLTVYCEPVPGGGNSLLLESDEAKLSAHDLEGGTLVVDVDDPDPSGWAGGARTCRGFATVQVVPGVVRGTDESRILVRPVGTPRVVASGSRVRLLWLPGPVSESAPSRERPAREARSATAEPPQAARPEPSPAEPPSRREEETRRDASAASRQPVAPKPEADAARRAEPSPTVSRRDSSSRTTPEPPARVAARLAAEAPSSDPQPLSRALRLQANIATEVRAQAGRRAEIVRRLAAGEVVTANARLGDWLELSAGGWVFGPYFAEPSADSAEYMALVVADRAQVRSGPGPKHDVVAEIVRGESVAIDDVSGPWAHVRNGGWVLSASLQR